MLPNKEKFWVRNFIIGTFVSLYLIVSLISTIHVIDFFKLSNPNWLAISLAVGFEIGAAASLASLIALQKMNRFIVWCLFFLLTGMQAMGNTYYAYSHLKDFTQWSELFGLIEEDLIYQKRILSIISGAILPLVALGFIKSLVDYIRPEDVEINISEKSLEIQDELTPNKIKTEEKLDGGSSSPVIPLEVIDVEVPESQIENIVLKETNPITEIPGILEGVKETDSVAEEKDESENKEEFNLDTTKNASDEHSTEDNKNSHWHRIFNNEDSPIKRRN
jgi:hypothetical protein